MGLVFPVQGWMQQDGRVIAELELTKAPQTISAWGAGLNVLALFPLGLPSYRAANKKPQPNRPRHEARCTQGQPVHNIPEQCPQPAYLIRIDWPRSPNRAKVRTSPASRAALILALSGSADHSRYSSGRSNTNSSSTIRGALPPLLARVSL